MKIKILNLQQLQENIAEYKAMFPQNYLSLDDVYRSLEADYRGGITLSVFGISVSDEWPDKCYSFRFVHDDDEIVYEYMGLYKC